MSEHVESMKESHMLQERHQWVATYVRKKVPAYLRESADDIIQDVMIKLLNADKKSDQMIVNYGYLKQTVMSVMIDHIRKHRNQQKLEEGIQLEAEPSVDDDKQPHNPAELLHQHSLLDVIYQHISTFSEDRQTALMLYFRGMKIREIVQLTGFNMAKVRNEIYRGKKDLIFHLNHLGYEYEV